MQQVPGHYDYRNPPVPLDELRRADERGRMATDEGAGESWAGAPEVGADENAAGFWAILMPVAAEAYYQAGKYSFVEAGTTPDGGQTLERLEMGRFGVHDAIEWNGNEDVPEDTVVWMTRVASRDYTESGASFRFSTPSTLVVSEVDGSPSITGVGEIRFDQASGFVVTEVGSTTPAVVQISLDTTGATYTYDTSEFNYDTTEFNYDDCTFNYAGNTTNNYNANNTTTLAVGVVLLYTGGSITYESVVEVCGPLLYCYASDTLAATEDDYQYPGLFVGTRTVLRLTPDATLSTVSGMVFPTMNGLVLYLMNVGTTGFIKLLHQSTASVPANRLSMPNALPLYIAPGGCVGVWYDGESDRWRVLTVECGGVKGIYAITMGDASERDFHYVNGRVVEISGGEVEGELGGTGGMTGVVGGTITGLGALIGTVPSGATGSVTGTITGGPAIRGSLSGGLSGSVGGTIEGGAPPVDPPCDTSNSYDVLLPGSSDLGTDWTYTAPHYVTNLWQTPFTSGGPWDLSVYLYLVPGGTLGDSYQVIIHNGAGTVSTRWESLTFDCNGTTTFAQTANTGGGTWPANITVSKH